MVLNFIKMNGTGNDFVIFDARPSPLSFTPAQLRAIADRNNPITKGCDQIIVLTPGGGMSIYNADGGEVSSCGNATRCVGWLLMEESKVDQVAVHTRAGDLRCERAGEKCVTVDMGPPRFAHKDIPTTTGVSLENISLEGLEHGMALGMGNPHVVFFVPDVNAVDLKKIGPIIEHRTDIFPERVNVSAATVTPSHITLRTWERGAGLTLACGTAACATLVAAARRNLTGRDAEIHMPGGTLRIEWRGDNHVWMTGPVVEEFWGEMKL